MNDPRSKPRPLPDPPRRRPSLLAGMRIRKKLIVLHTFFSLVLAGILVLALRPTLAGVVREAELVHAAHLAKLVSPSKPDGSYALPEGASVRLGAAVDLPIKRAEAERARLEPGRAVPIDTTRSLSAVYLVGGATDEGRFALVEAPMPEARDAVQRVYLLVAVSLLAVYALVAVFLELFVLPRHVYSPIRALLDADEAARAGRRADELVPRAAMPADELGEIMRSRNDTVTRLRAQERELASALDRLESVAGDLKRKNHLLETARRNLEGADRLASVGMMSAGIAHELNTPLSVAKGLVEKLAERPSEGLRDAEAQLLRRVVARLEHLSEGLLDFARARTPKAVATELRTVVEEAATLVRLDRQSMPPASEIEVVAAVPEGLIVECDADRMVQVFLNLIRNGVDAVREGPGRGAVRVEAERIERDGSGWVIARVSDTGPGIDAEMLPRIFEPFASSRLDARGTGLGLAVAEGIVREHGGAIVPSNRHPGPGASFEVMLPVRAPRRGSPAVHDQTSPRSA